MIDGNFWLDLIDGTAEVFILMLGFTYLFRKRISGGIYKLYMLVGLSVFTLINGFFMYTDFAIPGRFYAYLILMVLLLLWYGAYISKTDVRNILALDLYLCNTVVMSKTLAGMFVEGWMTLVIQYLILVLLLVFYVHVYEEVYFEISAAYWVCVMLVPLIITSLWQVWTGTEVGENPYVSVVVIVLDALVYFMFTRLINETKRQSELELSNDTLLFQIRQMDTVRDQFETVRSARHELKNNYFIIETYAEKEDYAGLKEYLHSEVLPALEVKDYVRTGNDFVDMILSQKIIQAQEKNIPIKMDVAVSDKISIRQQYLASLLFNLFDNAIEASEKIDAPDIYFYMHQDKGYLSLQIKNRIEGSVLSTNPDFITTKKDAKNHGIGTRIIQRIVNDCDGNIDYKEVSSYFIVSIMLPLQG